MLNDIPGYNNLTISLTLKEKDNISYPYRKTALEWKISESHVSVIDNIDTSYREINFALVADPAATLSSLKEELYTQILQLYPSTPISDFDLRICFDTDSSRNFVVEACLELEQIQTLDREEYSVISYAPYKFTSLEKLYADTQLLLSLLSTDDDIEEVTGVLELIK